MRRAPALVSGFCGPKNEESSNTVPSTVCSLTVREQVGFENRG
jgi:hypothetical protein